MVDKVQDVMTVSDRFRQDLVDFFGTIGEEWRCVEVGAYKGYTTRTLANLFKHVTAVDIDPGQQAANLLKFGLSNVAWVVWDSCDRPWPFGPAEVYMIDAVHTAQAVLSDTLAAIEDPACKYIVYDDYGAHEGVFNVVNNMVVGGLVDIVREVGYGKGELAVEPTNKWGAEGVICVVKR